MEKEGFVTKTFGGLVEKVMPKNDGKRGKRPRKHNKSEMQNGGSPSLPPSFVESPPDLTQLAEVQEVAAGQQARDATDAGNLLNALLDEA